MNESCVIEERDWDGTVRLTFVIRKADLIRMERWELAMFEFALHRAMAAFAPEPDNAKEKG